MAVAFPNAMFGQARFGATQFGRLSPRVYVSINGQEVAFARDAEGEQVDADGGINVDDVLNETPNTAQMTVSGFLPTTGMEVIVRLGSKRNTDRLFGGVILGVSQRQMAAASRVHYDISCTDFTWLLQSHPVTKRYRNQSGTAIVQDLIAAFAPAGFATIHVAAGLDTIDEITFTNEDLPDAISRTMERIGGDWYCDEFKDIHAFVDTETGVQQPRELNASSPTLLEFKYDTDLSGVITRVEFEGNGSTASVDVPASTTADVPTVVGVGSGTGGTGNITVTLPAHLDKDILLLCVESAAETVAAPSGWAAVDTPQTTGSSGSGVALSVFWKRALSGSTTSPVVLDPGDHAYGVAVAIRGCRQVGDPWDVVAGGVKSGASTATSIDGVTTTAPNSLVLFVITRDNDSAAANWSSGANASLTSVTEQIDGGTTQGNGGGLGIWSGIKATPGATGTLTATSSASIIEAFLCLSFSGEVTIPVESVAFFNANGGQVVSGPQQAIDYTYLDAGGLGTVVHGNEITAPGSFSAAASTTGSMTLGSYYYVITFKAADGGESIASPVVGPITLTGVQNAVALSSIPTSSDARVNRRYIYRTVVNGSASSAFTLTAVINDNSTGGLLDVLSEAGHSSPIQPPLVSTAVTEPTVAVGATTISVSDLSQVLSGGGWLVIAGQKIRYTGRAASSGVGNVTGVPASGLGSVTTTIAHLSPVLTIPFLGGIPQGSIAEDITSGDDVNLRVTVNDATAQSALATLLGGGDGVRTLPLQDRRLSETEAIAQATAQIELRKNVRSQLSYASRDKHTRSGRDVVVNFGAPTNVSTTLRIKSVAISNFTATMNPVYRAQATSDRFSFEELLRHVRKVS